MSSVGRRDRVDNSAALPPDADEPKTKRGRKEARVARNALEPARGQQAPGAKPKASSRDERAATREKTKAAAQKLAAPKRGRTGDKPGSEAVVEVEALVAAAAPKKGKPKSAVRAAAEVNAAAVVIEEGAPSSVPLLQRWTPSDWTVLVPRFSVPTAGQMVRRGAAGVAVAVATYALNERLNANPAVGLAFTLGVRAITILNLFRK